MLNCKGCEYHTFKFSILFP